LIKGEKTMLKKMNSVFYLLLVFSVMVFLTACNESDSSSKPNVNPTTKGYPNGGLLADASDLTESGVFILDARSADAYNAGHIPKALSTPWQMFSDSQSMLKPVSELETLLGAAGIKRDTWMIIYDDTTASWGAAGRLFWMFEYLGCPNVRILDGGWDKWIADGNQAETKVRTRKAKTFTATVNDNVVCDKGHIAGRLNDRDFGLIDTRTDAEFIGWQLYGEQRGGHITGAKHLPYEGYFQADKTILDYAAMKSLFDSKGVTADKETVAYCTVGIRSAYAYFLCRLMGYQRASNYDASILDWAGADAAAYHMEKMRNYQALVHPAWVDDLIKEKNPPTYPGNGYVIVFTSWWPRWETNEISTTGAGLPFATDGHIPGAIFLDTYSIETGPGSEYGDGYANPSESYVKTLPELQAFFASMGITKDKTVVVYADDDITLMTAGRIAWALLYAGVDDVRVLNGGYDAWVAGGYPVEKGPTAWSPVADFGESPGNLQYLATTEDIQNVINGIDQNGVIVDDRSWDEFTGASNSYYWWFDNRGRIPRAQWIGDWDAIARADHQSFMTYTEAESNWKESGFSPDKKMYFYCGGGARSAQYTFYAYLLGWPAANYEGGWFLWSYNGNPWEKGHSEKLVSAKWVKGVLNNNNDGKPYVIVETGWGPASDSYKEGHLPEAIWVNTDEIEYDCFNARNDWPVDEGEPACWDRSATIEEDAAKGLGPDDALPRNWWDIYPDQYLLPAIAYMGIDKNTRVVVYGDEAIAAARVLWTLMYAGVKDVRFLNGGKKAWEAAGYELETVVNVRRPVDAFDPDDPGRTTAIHPEYKVDIPYVRDVVNRVVTDALILDIRSWDEYTGKSAPYDYIPTSGRVPGAIWGKAGSGPSSMEDYVNEDGTLKSPVEIYPYWNSKGMTTDKHLSFYCGTAWRSSLAWFYAYMIGYPDISNFDDSWFKWSMGPGSAYNGDDPVLNPIVDQFPNLP